MNLKSILLCLIIVCIAMATGCTTSKTENGQTPDESLYWVKEKMITCVSDGVPVYRKPDPIQQGNWLTSVKLGEVLTYLGETVTDTTKKAREYFHVQLSDGTEGWALSYGLMLYSKPAVITIPSVIYDRPDQLAVTAKKLEPMEIVAITNVKEGWAEFTSEQKKYKGWIPAGNFTEIENDILVAVLFRKEMKKQDQRSEKQKIADFLQNLPTDNSVFIPDLEKRLEALQGNTADSSLVVDEGYGE
ncbi:MAG: hypothetical protein U0T82_09645 [Bacteroidales bacterium]